MKIHLSKLLNPPDLIRRLILSWLLGAVMEYLLLPASYRALPGMDAFGAVSLGRFLLLVAGVFSLLSALAIWCNTQKAERWSIVAAFALLSLFALNASFTVPFFVLCLLITAALVIYAIKGWNGQMQLTFEPVRSGIAPVVLTAALAVGFVVFVSLWTVGRVLCMSTPTYDMGIFSQMFYSMRTTGMPITTVERDGPLSHFMVHMSPVYYLLLPFYCIYPKPETLQVLQAMVLASSVIPLWLLAGRRNLSPWIKLLLCALLLLYPSLSGGTGYDIHENCFLTPLLLWLFYAMERRSAWLTGLFALLTLCVKEDAAVYVAVAGLYLTLRAVLHREDKKTIFTGIGVMSVAIVWFIAATAYINTYGDGLLTDRFYNFSYNGSFSMMNVIKTVLLIPMKALFECVDAEKLSFIGLTLLPLAGLPFFTRRYERYVLLIPYVLFNLMPDYRYLHDIFFQYTFGSAAFLFYLVVLNVSDFKIAYSRLIALGAAVVLCATAFFQQVYPVGMRYPQQYEEYKDYYTFVRQMLDKIPQDASVAATTYYTTYLSDRDELYDVKYCSRENLLSCQYVALHTTSSTNYTRYAVNGEKGYENLAALLEENGYTIFAKGGNYLVIYVKADQ